MIREKSVHSPVERSRDGLRVLATRFRGRGLRKTRYDVWMPNLAPSERLVRSFQAGELTWGEFRRRYKAELFEDGSVDERNEIIKNHGQKFTLRLLKALAKRQPLTVMCLCSEDQTRCHRHILAQMLKRNI